MSSKKRGLSAEEKRQRLLELLREKKDFFLLKELEKIAPKEKGIIPQSVKEVLQSLVDDNLVDSEKIGTSVYFWAFPSKATASHKRRLQEKDEAIQDAKKRLKTAENSISQAKVGREDGDKRAQALEELVQLTTKKDELLQEVQKYRDCDPEVLNQLKEEVKIAKESANRWTDNIFALHSWIGKKFPNISIKDLNKQFGIPEDMDYVA